MTATGDKLVTVDGLAAAFKTYHKNSGTKMYGVRFPSGGSNVGTRLWNAEGLTATPTFGTTVGSSGFSDTEMFKYRRCNVKNGSIVAYSDYPEFDEYGENGDVFEQWPNGYFYISDDETVYGISKYQINEKWAPFYIASDGSVPEYLPLIGAYKMSMDADGYGHSIAGVNPKWSNYQTLMTAAQKNGENYHLGPSWYENWKQIMTFVEYGSRDVQNASGMQGFAGGAWDDKTLYAVTDSNVIPMTTVTNFAIGQRLWSDNADVNDRFVTAVDTTAKTITISGDPVTVAQGANVTNIDWQCGHTLLVNGDTGQQTKSNRYGMKWHGIEDMWGGSNEAICDLRIKLADGETTNPTEYWYCPDPRQAGYADNGNDYYINTGIVGPGKEGYAKSFKAPTGYPNVRLLVEVGASSTTYYADYYHTNTSATGARAVRSGGNWYYGAYLGVSCRNCYHAASTSDRNCCARLFLTRS